MMPRILLVCLMACFFCGCATSAARLQYGESSFQKEDYNRAFYLLLPLADYLLLPLAEKGNCDAQYAVGYMYYYGKGVVEDTKQAQYWINLAAKQGQPLAIKALAAQAAVASDCPPAISPYVSQ